MLEKFSSLALGLGLAASPVVAQNYERPPAELARLVDAALTPAVSVSTDESTLLLMDRPSLPTIAELAEPELRLAGLRINPRTNGPSRAVSFNALRLVDVASGRERVVSGLPQAPRIRNAAWSPDSRYVAFTIDTNTAIELWLLSRGDAAARRLGSGAVNHAMGGRALYWLDSATIVARMVPGDRDAAPADSGVPAGPVIQENLGKTAPARTYQDLLQTPTARTDREAQSKIQNPKSRITRAVSTAQTPGASNDTAMSARRAEMAGQGVSFPRQWPTRHSPASKKLPVFMRVCAS